MNTHAQYIWTLVQYKNAFMSRFGRSWYLATLGQAIDHGEHMLRELDLQALRDKYETTIRTK